MSATSSGGGDGVAAVAPGVDPITPPEPAPEAHHGHYPQELRKALSVVTNIALTLSAVTPASSVFIIIPVLFAIVGSGTFLALVFAALIGVAMSLCWSELGAAYPIVGGDYALVRRVLGRAPGFVTLILSGPVQAILIPAVIALGMSQYLGVIFHSNANDMAAIVIGISSVIAILGVRFNAYFTGTFLAAELLALGAVSILGFVHAQQPVKELFSPHTFAAGGHASSLTTGLLLSGLAVAIFAYNGYQNPVTFSEEMHGPRRGVARAILWSLGITVAAELIPTTAALLGTPSLAGLTTAGSPMQYLIKSLSGSTLNTIVSLAIAGAIFNAVIAIILYYARVLYGSGRDKAWPGPMSDAFAAIHPRFRTPWVGTLFVGVIGIVLVLTTNVVTLSTWTGVALAIDYALIALAALVSRVTQRQLERPYRMPLWPIAPLFAIAGCVITLTKQTSKDLRIAGIVVACSLAYYYLYLHPRRKTHWLMLNPIREDDA
jgi:amino acid transporter